MRRLFDTIATYVLPEGGFTIHEGFYQSACLVAGLMAVFVIIPINAFQTLPDVVDLSALVFGVLAFGLYWLARRNRYYPGLLLGALLVVPNVDWFPNAASTGSIIYYFFAAALYPIIFFRGVRRWATAALERPAYRAVAAEDGDAGAAIFRERGGVALAEQGTGGC